MFAKLARFLDMEERGKAGGGRIAMIRWAFEEWKLMAKNWVVKEKRIRGIVRSMQKIEQQTLRQAFQTILKFK